MINGYCSTTEAAQKLGVSIDTVKRMCNDGRITGAVKLAGRYIIPVAEVEKYLVPVEQAAEVEAAAMARWSNRRKASGNYNRKSGLLQ